MNYLYNIFIVYMSALVDGRKSPVDTVLPNVMERSIMNFNIIKEIPIIRNNNEYQKSIQYKWFGRIYDDYSFESGKDTMDKLEKLDEEFYKQLDGILAEVKDEMKLKYKKGGEIKQINEIPNDLLRTKYHNFFRPIGMSFLTKLKTEEVEEERRRKRTERRPKITYTDEFIPVDVLGKRKSPSTTGGKRKKRRTKKKRRKRNLKKRTRRRRRKSKRRRRR